MKACAQAYDNLLQHNPGVSVLGILPSPSTACVPVPVGNCYQPQHEAALLLAQLITLYHKTPPSICHHLAKGYIDFYFLHLFHSRYESFTFRVLPLVVQFRLARLHDPDGDKLSRPSICQTTREVRICQFYLLTSSRKSTEIPRISKRRWKDHQVTQMCRPCAPLTLCQHCPW